MNFLFYELDDTLSEHSLCDLHKAGDVSTLHIVDVTISLRAVLDALLVDGRHDVVELLINLLSTPVETDAVLGHLETRSSNTTSVDSLARSEELLSLNECLDSLCGATHVADLDNADRLASQDLLSVLAVELVLDSASHVDLSLSLPRLLASVEGRTRELVSVRSANVVAAIAEVEHVLDLLIIQTVRVVDVAVRTRDGHDLGTELSSLLGSTPSHVTEARDSNRLALDVDVTGLQHVLYEVESAETSSLRTEDRATKLKALTSQGSTVELAGELLVLTEEVANLAATNTYVASGNVTVRADVLVELAS